MSRQAGHNLKQTNALSDVLASCLMKIFSQQDRGRRIWVLGETLMIVAA